MTKSVRLLVVGVATVASLLAWSDDAVAGPFRRQRNCQTCCVTTCCPTVTCAAKCTTCTPVARATMNCCNQVVTVAAQAPAPQPLPNAGAQPAAQAPAAAPTTVTGQACTNCGTATSSCNVCCVPTRGLIRRVSYSTACHACTTVTTTATNTTQPAATANTTDPCNDCCCVVSARRFRIRR